MENELRGFKCKKCGKIAYPKRPLCVSCKGRDFEESPLGAKGKIVTFTNLWAIPEGIDQLPLTLAIVEFLGNVRVTGQVDGEVKVGDLVHPVWGPIRKIRGKQIEGFRFQRI